MQTVHKKVEADEYVVATGGLKLTKQYDRYTIPLETRSKIRDDSDSGGSTSSCSGGGGSGRSGNVLRRRRTMKHLFLRRFLPALLCLVLALSLTACGGGTEPT